MTYKYCPTGAVVSFFDMVDPNLQFVATDVLYFHPADERAFFDWLDRMSFVEGYHGVVRDLFINLSRAPTYDLWEIIGFCRRYGIDLSQLRKFITEENRGWLPDEIAWSPTSTSDS